MPNEKEFVPQDLDQIDTSDLERYIGRYVAQPPQAYYYATYDTIRHFAWAIDDYNALYTDEKFARETRWGDVIAPPGYLYAHTDNFTVWSRTVGDIPGITHRDNAGENWEFYLPVYHGDYILSNARTYDVQKRMGRRIGPMLIVSSETLFTNQRGEVVARNVGASFRFNRASMVERGGMAQRVTGQEGGVLREVPDDPPPRPEHWGTSTNLRHDQQRYFEEVNVGDEMPTMNRGMYHPSQGLRRTAATTNPLRIYPGEAIEVRTRPDGPMSISYAALGVYRTDWFGHFVTMWAGPNAWLSKLSYQNREWNLPGYDVIVKGRVTGKRAENGKNLVDLDVWVENELGMVTNPGHATVELPSLKPSDES